jgi:hypothetical protein
VKGDLMPTVEDALYRCVHHLVMEMEQSNFRLEPGNKVRPTASLLKTRNTGSNR